MVKKSENLEKSQKIPFFSKNLKILKIYFLFVKKKKNAISLVLPNEEISLRPELSSPPRFRIQGGYPERDIQTNEGRTKEILVSKMVKKSENLEKSQKITFFKKSENF